MACTRPRVGVTMIGLTSVNYICGFGLGFGNLNVHHGPTAICIHEFSSSTKCPKPPCGCHPTIEEYQYGLLMNSVGCTKSKV